MPASLPSASQPTITCYTKSTWAAAWTERPILKAMRITEQVAPGHSSAVLEYRYGQAILPAIGSRPADSSAATIARGSLNGHYVKVTVSGLGDWYGIITDVVDSRGGLLGTTVPSGSEVYSAFGLTWLLDNCPPVRQSEVKTGTGTTTIIDRAIPFNGGTDGRQKANRIAWKNYDSTEKCFTDSTKTTSPAAWTAANAVEYLLANFSPKNAAGSVLVPFALHSSALTFLDYELPLVAYEGLTPWQILTRLIDRRRGLGFHATISSGTVEIVAWSQNASTLTLPSGSSIPANGNTMTYNFDNAINIRDAQVTTSLLTRYDQVVCIGERAGSVFTVRPETNFEPDWTSTQETAYNTAASGKTGYSSLSDADKEAANQDRRAADDLARVFSWWRLRSAWSGRSDTDPSSGSAPYAFPQIDSDGYLTTGTAANVHRGGLRVQTFLPMRQGVDYSSGAITPATSDGDTAEGDFIPPFLLFQTDPIRTSTSDAGWVHCERLNQPVDSGSTKRAHTYSVDLAVREDAPGLVLRTVGKPQHYIAEDLYDANGSFEAITTGEGIDHDSWLATIYMLQDNYCRAQYPEQDDLPSLDLVRQLSLQIPGAYCDYIVPGTVVGVDAGELKKTTDGGYLRDDRPRLRDLARLAFAWYGQERRILSLSFKGITTGFAIGHLITTIGSGATLETINTCITSITYDLQGGTTSLQTQFGEMDFASL